MGKILPLRYEVTISSHEIMSIDNDVSAQEPDRSSEQAESTDPTTGLSVSAFENMIEKLNQAEKLIQEVKEEFNKLKLKYFAE